jgi:hypothetical protein
VIDPTAAVWTFLAFAGFNTCSLVIVSTLACGYLAFAMTT